MYSSHRTDSEHLTEREVDKLIEAAKGDRHGTRDATMILICFRHGLRASELCELQWSDVAFESAALHLRRAKGGSTGTHPLLGDELRALRALKRDAPIAVHLCQRARCPFSVSGLQKMIERAGVEARLPFKVHPHMLRHATGYALANKGTDIRTLQAYRRFVAWQVPRTPRRLAPSGRRLRAEPKVGIAARFGKLATGAPRGACWKQSR